GHDEPSVLFYSNTAGSGNSSVYQLTIPSDPPTVPLQNATGGTFHFQLHPTFWFGMVLCDDQSAPNPGGSPLACAKVACTPDSDANIFTNTAPGNANYLGKHPGTAFMELQFYPPGWVHWPAGNSCDPTKWCAAMAIFSLSTNQNTGVDNNGACLNIAGIEPANFAFITRTGVPIGPPDPLNATLGTFTPTSNKPFMIHSAPKAPIPIP